MKPPSLALLALALSLGCSDELPVDSASAEIGAAGGEVELRDGTRVEIPAGALDGDVTVGVERRGRTSVSPPPGGRAMKSDPYAFTPHGTGFRTPVKVTLRSTDDGQDFRVMRLRDENDTNWRNVPGASRLRDEVSFEVDAFSIYAVVEAPAPDAGTDAGAPDAGILDGGAAPDGGPLPTDAGFLDAGPPP